jgi:glycosyltransferase involved in cell wall biosynthesis
MKIALLSYEYPPDTGFGGIGTYTWHQARALAKLGHEVHVIAGSLDGTPLKAVFGYGVTVWRANGHGGVLRAVRHLDTIGLHWTRNRLENALNMRSAVRELDRRIGFDVIESPECGADSLFVSRVSDAPVIVRFQSPAELIMPFYDVSRLDRLACAAAERVGIRRARGLIAGSAFVAREAARALGVRRPVTVIPNGIDLDWFDSQGQIDAARTFHIPRNRVSIFFGARMERRKGVHLFREILLGVLERVDVSFVLAGRDETGYVRSTLLPEVRQRARQGSVQYLGQVGLNEVRSCLCQTDIFFFPSLWDNCPSACLEAMAAGQALVCSDAGGISELIAHNENGLLAAAGEPGGFIDALCEMAEDGALRARLGAAARKTVEDRFTDTFVAARSVDEYRRYA